MPIPPSGPPRRIRIAKHPALARYDGIEAAWLGPDDRSVLAKLATGMRAFDLIDGTEREVAGALARSWRSAGIAPDGALLLADGDEAVLCDPSGTVTRRWRWDGILACDPRFSRDGKYVAIPLRESVAIFEVAKLPKAAKLDGDARRVSPGIRIPAQPDGMIEAFDAGTDMVVLAEQVEHARPLRFVSVASVWRVSTAAQLATRELAHEARPTCAAIAPDDSLVVIGTTAGRLLVLNPADTLGTVAATAAHDDEVSSVVFAPTGHCFVSCGPLNVRVWDGKTGALIATSNLPEPGEKPALRGLGTTRALATDPATLFELS